MKGLVFIAGGSNAWGMGHLKRGLEIVRLLKAQGFAVESLAYVPAGEDQGLSSVLDLYDQTIHAWPQVPGPCVVDLPLDVQESFLTHAQKAQLKVFAIEWYPPRGSIVVDAVNLREGKEGLRYAIIRNQIVEQIRKPQEKIYDCIMMLGGKDQKGYLKKLVDLFLKDSRLNGFKAVVIIGPMDPMAIDKNIPGLEVYQNPPNLAQLMAASKVGLSNAGTSLLEMCALGIPTIIFPQTALEKEFAQVFIETGCSVMGKWENHEVIGQITELCKDNSLWTGRSKRAHDLIDGQGAVRIVNRIKQAL